MEGVRYEEPAPGIARIVLARPEKRNAQNKALLYALNAAFDRAAQDDDIKVILLAADGPHFSSGHDLEDASSLADFEPVGSWLRFFLGGCPSSRTAFNKPLRLKEDHRRGLSIGTCDGHRVRTTWRR